jgi:hypothetical protein
VTAALRQQALVAETLRAEELGAEEPGAGAGALVRVALCFSGTEVGLFTRPFTLEGVLVTWPRAFARVLGAAGALGPVERRVLAARIARAFPPYAPGGTSHRPTGASPRR